MGDAPGGGADGLVATADVGYPSAGDAPRRVTRTRQERTRSSDSSLPRAIGGPAYRRRSDGFDSEARRRVPNAVGSRAASAAGGPPLAVTPGSGPLPGPARPGPARSATASAATKQRERGSKERIGDQEEREEKGERGEREESLSLDSEARKGSQSSRQAGRGAKGLKQRKR